MPYYSAIEDANARVGGEYGGNFSGGEGGYGVKIEEVKGCCSLVLRTPLKGGNDTICYRVGITRWDDGEYVV